MNSLYTGSDAGPPGSPQARPHRLRLLLPLFLTVVALLGGTAQVSLAGAGSRPNIILVIADTLRADHLGTYGYFRPTTPHLDHLATESVLFENAFTVMPHTLPAHLALFTSRYPREMGVLMNGQTYAGQFPTLAQHLQEAGYNTAAFVSSLAVKGKFGLDRGFDIYVDSTHHKPPGTVALTSFRDWLGSRQEQPFFAWIHLMEPHVPYAPPRDLANRFRSDAGLRAWVQRKGIAPAPTWGATIDKIVVTQRKTPARSTPFLNNLNLYDAETLSVDQVIGELMAALKARDLDQDSLIMILSDHGEGLGQHGYYFHGLYLYEEQLQIPLLIRLPGGRHAGRRIAEPVSLLDILPTVSSLLDLKPGDGLRGRNLLPLMAGKQAGEFNRRPLFAESREYPPRRALSPEHWTSVRRFSVRDGSWKLIRATSGEAELYDLAADQNELADLHEENPAVARRLGRVLDKWLAKIPKGEAAGTDNLTDEDRRRLKSLGYVGGQP
ncbi:MAG: sulfatase [Acidobacteria bacterium]|nr:sulfatase [Acidobacteriota bacterium]